MHLGRGNVNCFEGLCGGTVPVAPPFHCARPQGCPQYFLKACLSERCRCPQNRLWVNLWFPSEPILHGFPRLLGGQAYKSCGQEFYGQLDTRPEGTFVHKARLRNSDDFLSLSQPCIATVIAWCNAEFPDFPLHRWEKEQLPSK